MAWNYDQPNALYKGDVFGELMKRKLIGVALRDKKSNVYLSQFHGYFDLLKGTDQTEVSKALLDDKAVWREVLDDEGFRRFFLSLDAMKLLFVDFHDAKTNGFTKSVYTASATLALFAILENELDLPPKKLKAFTNSLGSLLGGSGEYTSFVLDNTPPSFWTSATAKKVLKTKLAKQTRERLKGISGAIKLLKQLMP